MDSIEFTGVNGAEVRDWVNETGDCPAGETWFLTKGMSASTGAQAWNYAKAGRHWPQKVKATVYDPTSGTWHPVRPGDRVTISETGGFAVIGPRR